MTDGRADQGNLARLRGVIDALRTPGTGCPWDLQQTARTMGPYLLEEAFEALEAIEAGDPATMREELGDVLMNVFLIARIAEDEGHFDLDAVAGAVADKLIRRHPHVFGQPQVFGQPVLSGQPVERDPDAVLRSWEAIKLAEQGSGASDAPAGKRGLLAGVPRTLPALLKALRVGEKAARVGFDWPDAQGPRAKVTEELAELDAACAQGDRAEIERELGDVLFSLANLARHLGVEPETALRGTIETFMRRFAHVEASLGERLAGAPLADMEAAWQDAKRREAQRQP